MGEHLAGGMCPWRHQLSSPPLFFIQYHQSNNFVYILSKSPSHPAGTTIATTLYDRLRNDLLAGRHPPGSKLTLEPLISHYGAGQTPLREALNRLVADGLVERRDQRGFAVPPISRDDLLEITETRCWLEEVGLRQSMARADAAWEESLILAQHRLARLPRLHNPDTYEENPQWEALHREFHEALLAACGSRWLIRFCQQLADQWYRYRQLTVVRAVKERQVNHEHAEILEAVLARDPDRAVTCLVGHYRRTAQVLLDDASLWPQP